MTEQNFPLYEEGIAVLKKKDKKLAWLIEQMGRISHTDPKDDFLFFVEQVVGQMLSIKVANVIIGRLTDACRGKITVDTICGLTVERFRSLGISTQKAVCIRQIAFMVENGSLDFEKLKEQSDEEIIKFLTAIKGIGSWTAKMYLYKINRPDVLPYEDATFLSAYKWLYHTPNVKPEAVKHRCRKWSPYSSIAAMYLYAAFDGKLISTKSPKLKEL